MVRLKAGAFLHSVVVNDCFNSKMVRLKEIFNYSQHTEANSFNSKMVRLKVMPDHLKYIPSLCFNSKMVRLKEKCRLIQPDAVRVSIPKWYD